MPATYFIASLFLLLSLSGQCQVPIAQGEQPQVTQDRHGKIRIVYGHDDKIFFVKSVDGGLTFTHPELVAEVKDMHLGMTRGPQLATSNDLSLITCIDKAGNIHSFLQPHATEKWEKLNDVNDVVDSAPEGLMDISADDHNNFYAVWLDLRQGKKNNICFSSLRDKKWSKNKFAYVSPESHVCECCKPSIVVRNKTMVITFRNWMYGARDPYLVTSTDLGKTFSAAQKLGSGTWHLNGCPMDGGGVYVDLKNNIFTAWQREGYVFIAEPGRPEQRIAKGRHVDVADGIISWQNDSSLMVRTSDGKVRKVGEGSAIKVTQLRDNSIFAVWEKDGQVVSSVVNNIK